MIQVEELTKDYGSRRAIDHLTFNARQGEILGFLGPNGAGKTTTMRILTGYLPPSSGNVVIGGFDLATNSLEVRKIVGYLPETVPLYPDLTIFSYLKYMADLRHLRDAADRVMEVLEQVHLEDRSQSYIAKLSKGMRQRVGLAQALLHQPQVLILDEPTIGLDPVQIIEVRNLIREIGKERTVLLSTHILSEAQQVCNRVLIINQGKIVAEDTPSRLQHRLSGSSRVQISTRGDIAGLSDRLSGIQGVEEISQMGDNRLEFTMNPSVDPRPVVAKTIISSGYDLLEMKEVGLSLEEIFLQLTRDATPEPALSDHEEMN